MKDSEDSEAAIVFEVGTSKTSTPIDVPNSVDNDVVDNDNGELCQPRRVKERGFWLRKAELSRSISSSKSPKMKLNVQNESDVEVGVDDRGETEVCNSTDALPNEDITMRTVSGTESVMAVYVTNNDDNEDESN